MLVAVDAVVVTGNVHVGKGVAGLDVAAMQGGTVLHELAAQQARQIVEELAAHGLFLFGGVLGLLFGFFVAVHTKSDGAEEVEEDVHTAGHRAGIIQAVQIPGELLRQGNALFLSRLADLIAGGIQDHTRVVVVLFDHAFQVAAPPVVEIVHIVVLGLVDVPVVDVLIHHQHTLLVADVQQGLGTGVVGRTDGVVAVLVQDAHLAAHRIRVAHCTQQAVVVVDAGTLQDDPAAVEQQALPAPGKAADAKAGRCRVGAVGRLQGVQLRVLRAPERCLRQFQAHRLSGLSGRTGQHGSAVQHLQLHGAGGAGRRRDFHFRRVDGHGAHPQAVQQQVCFRAHPQGDRAVDARAGIPAAVGLVGVAGDHLQHVFGVKVQLPGQVCLEVGVAVGVERQLLAVEPDFGVVVHALEFQHKGLALQGCIRGEAFFVKVIIALVPAGVGASGGRLGTGFGQCRIMGQGDRHGRPLFQQVAAGPAGVERTGDHRHLPPFI